MTTDIGTGTCFVEESNYSIVDKSLCLPYSVISPEGLSSILWKDASLAEKAADSMKLTAKDLFELGVIDKIIEEPMGDAQKDVNFVSENIKDYIEKELKPLRELSNDKLLDDRYNKIRAIGTWE